MYFHIICAVVLGSGKKKLQKQSRFTCGETALILFNNYFMD